MVLKPIPIDLEEDQGDAQSGSPAASLPPSLPPSPPTPAYQTAPKGRLDFLKSPRSTPLPPAPPLLEGPRNPAPQ